MSENPETGRPEQDDEDARDSLAGDLSSKIDPDFIPPDEDENPNEERARENPEETGS